MVPPSRFDISLLTPCMHFDMGMTTCPSLGQFWTTIAYDAYYEFYLFCGLCGGGGYGDFLWFAVVAAGWNGGEVFSFSYYKNMMELN
jgi:hypothetical protein